MTPLASLLSWVHDDLPAVPRLVALRALNKAARDFCSYSTLWRAPMAPMDVAAEDQSVALVPPVGAEVLIVHAAWFNKREMPVTNMVAVEAARAAGTTADEPLAVSLLEPSVLALVPAPRLAATQALRVVVSLQPVRESQDGGNLPDYIVARYGEALGAGAKELLCLQPGRPWTSVQNADLYRASFRAACGLARRAAETTYGAEQSRVMMRKWV